MAVTRATRRKGPTIPASRGRMEASVANSRGRDKMRGNGDTTDLPIQVQLPGSRQAAEEALSTASIGPGGWAGGP